MPLTIFTNQIPVTTDASSVEGAAGVTLGTLFTSDQEGVARGVRFYLGSRAYDGAALTGGLFDWDSGDLLAQQTYTVSAADQLGYVAITFQNQPLIIRNKRYIAAVWFPCDTSPDGHAHYAYTSGFFGSGGVDNAPLHALPEDLILARRNGLFTYGAAIACPTSSFNAICYFVDISFDYIARMPVRNQTTGQYEQKIIKYRQGGQWRY